MRRVVLCGRDCWCIRIIGGTAEWSRGEKMNVGLMMIAENENTGPDLPFDIRKAIKIV